MLINGQQDRIIPTAYAEGYARPMRAAGDDVRVRMIDRTGHVELVAPETAAWAAAVEEIAAGARPMSFTLAEARAADAADPLRPLRDRFHLPEGLDLSRRQFARAAAQGGGARRQRGGRPRNGARS